jgi:hypothetical protein
MSVALMLTELAGGEGRVGTGREARPTLVTIQLAAHRSTQPNRLASPPPSVTLEAMSVVLMLTELAGSERQLAGGDGPGGPSHAGHNTARRPPKHAAKPTRIASA